MVIGPAACSHPMKPFLVTPGTKAGLGNRNPGDTSAFQSFTKESAGRLLDDLRREIKLEQAKLLAGRGAKVLIIFHSTDAGGKDGVVRNVFSGLDPHGLSVHAFKAPTPEELSHDFLWRVHRHCPARGELTIFNRSHYEDIVTVRVKNLAPEAVWQKRYQHVLAFERMLADEGTLILKFFLQIDADEQKKRFEQRLHNPQKQWKICAADLEDRKRFGEIQAAYDDVITATSTHHAPWFVIPANVKWCRNLIVAAIVRDALVKLKLSFPALDPALANRKIE